MKRLASFAMALAIVLAWSIPTAACEPVPVGCTPGYWKQAHHFGNWIGPYDPEDKFEDHFTNDAFGDKTLLQVLRQGGGGKQALGRHLVAALLNSAYFETTPQFIYNVPLWPGDTVTVPGEVIDKFNQVYPGTRRQYTRFKNRLAAANQTGCPLGRALRD